MSKFNTGRTRTNVTSPVRTVGETTTYEGGQGYTREPKGELFTLAITSLVSEDTFYEGASDRDERFRSLIHKVVGDDPEWVGRMAAWLRGKEVNLRSAPLVIAAEYVRAGGPKGRAVINSVLQRADEPGEFLAYWTSQVGRSLPAAVQRGVADAVQRLYNERSALKYDGSRGEGFRMGDVVELIHPKPTTPSLAEALRSLGLSTKKVIEYITDQRKVAGEEFPDDERQEIFAPGRGENFVPAAIEALKLSGNEASALWATIRSTERQAALFAYLLDRRHHPQEIRANLGAINTIRAARQLDALPEGERRTVLRERGSDALAEAGYTWERLSGWLPGGMDAEAWNSIIPSMGYMALLRNLRNFDQAGISDTRRQEILAKLQDPEQVANSRQFPYRFWSAYKNAPSLEWGAALEKALDLSVQNIPVLRGRTLVMIDVSGSMNTPVSQKSNILLHEIGSLFGMATAKRSGYENVDVVLFASSNTKLPVEKSLSVLRGIERVQSKIGSIGYGTEALPALSAHYNGHDRVCIFTDCQIFPYGYHDGAVLDSVPSVYVWNLGGYRAAMIKSGERGRHEFGGFSDACFRLVSLLERGANADWPF